MAFFRDDSTGKLTFLSGSATTFNDDCVPSAIDPQGRFVYSTCGDGATMYTLDSTTAAVTEVPNAPFAVSQLQGFIINLVIPESSGPFVYVLKQNYSGTDLANNFYLDTFQVDAATPTLVPVSSQQLSLVGAGLVGSVSVAADPNGHGLALFVDQRNSSLDANPNAVLYTISFDPLTGVATFDPSGGQNIGQNARAIAISPTGNYLALTYGVLGGTLVSYSVAQSSFTLSSNGAYFLGPDVTPAGSYRIGGAIYFNPGGQIVYVPSAPPDFTGGLPFQLFDPGTYLILPASPLPFSDATFFDALPDPQGPFVYSSQSTDGIGVHYVDPVSGRSSQSGPISSPFYPQFGLIPPVLAPFGPTGGQGTSGPVLSLSFPSLTFAQITAGQSSAPLYITLKNVGNEVVSLNSISLIGANSTDFQLNNGCNPPALAANQSCALSIVYSPAAAGASNASIVVASNVPQSPQVISLTGTSIAPLSSVNFNPASIVFPATTEGTTSNPIVLTLTNSGGASLHITGTAFGGSNVPDFSFAPTNCTGTINAGASCTLSVTFTPLAAGIRTATWAVTDDAAGSPHIVSITGTGAPAVQIAAAPGGSTTVSVSAGQAAQFNLQATAGNGFSGTLSFTCSGVPFGATCVPPVSLTVTSGSSAPFTVSINTLGASALVPSVPISSLPFRPAPWLIAALLAAFAAFLCTQSRRGTVRFTRPSTIAATALSLCLIFSGIGCGGAASSSTSSTTPPPAQQFVATPSIQPAGGTFSAAQSISITDATPGATIYFTTDGSAPTASSSVYSTPLSLNSAATIKAMASASNYSNNPVASSAFSFRSPAGTYPITVNVTATATGSTKSIQLTPIILTLTVN